MSDRNLFNKESEPVSGFLKELRAEGYRDVTRERLSPSGEIVRYNLLPPPGRPTVLFTAFGRRVSTYVTAQIRKAIQNG